MMFPTIAEITLRDTVTISDDTTLEEAVDVMLSTPYSHIVVEKENKFCLLEVYDLICFYRLVDKTTLLQELRLEPLEKVEESMRVIDTVAYLREGVETLAVIDGHGRFVGIVLQTDIISSIDPETLMANYRVVDLFKIKKRNRWIDKTTLMKTAIDEMQMKHYDAYLVVEARKPVGILTSKDMLRLVRKGVDLNLTVEHYMSAPIQTLSARATLKEAMAFMQRTGFKRIVTTDENGYLVGSLTYKELFSIAYTKWVASMTRYQQELRTMNAQLEEKTREYEVIAAYDTLTGLYNRRKFLELFVLEYTVMQERRNSMAVMIIDIDHFKMINDTYGHNTGDIVLKELAHILKEAFRDVDIVARWGGDEFVALLPAADKKVAFDIAEYRIRQKVKKLMIDDIDVTVSIGVADVMTGDNAQHAIGRADAMLYEAKRRGRDCVVVAA